MPLTAAVTENAESSEKKTGSLYILYKALGSARISQVTRYQPFHGSIRGDTDPEDLFISLPVQCWGACCETVVVT